MFITKIDDAHILHNVQIYVTALPITQSDLLHGFVTNTKITANGLTTLTKTGYLNSVFQPLFFNVKKWIFESCYVFLTVQVGESESIQKDVFFNYVMLATLLIMHTETRLAQYSITLLTLAVEGSYKRG